ncbi:hypothetical protein CLAVI_000971 [Candidatus Clavichlamydia salmonicola]|uniref:hypothetical protein n=1 Tax=Candidatus Clavichlamydia salmonicola TaxID=469812 RepID=UPI0018911EFB|nr:hypothetical protein [Candidatus Clavichlamydia salmonicola]MBF5051330.1 hypothetical protein [Candidatus Clavichlamydia salmonicola]
MFVSLFGNDKQTTLLIKKTLFCKQTLLTISIIAGICSAIFLILACCLPNPIITGSLSCIYCITSITSLIILCIIKRKTIVNTNDLIPSKKDIVEKKPSVISIKSLTESFLRDDEMTTVVASSPFSLHSVSFSLSTPFSFFSPPCKNY